MLIGHAPDELAEILITEYPAGAGIGWHRDAPNFGPAVVGLSLGSACRFRFRREYAGKMESFTATLEPRSAYILGGEGAPPLATFHSTGPGSPILHHIQNAVPNE